MKKLKVYIDFGDVPDFAEKLKGRIKNIDGIGEVVEYNDLKPKDSSEDFDWEDITLKAIKKADIVIPILTPVYLSYLTEGIESLFNNIIDSKSKFLFPIFYENSEWSSYKWVVRSNLIPNDGEPLSDKDKKKADELINDLIKTIKEIIIKFSTDFKSQDEHIGDSKPSEDNIIFISHDHDDADFAELLKLKLEKNELNGWIDSERLKIGQDWREEIDQGIQNSIAVIAIMTPEARKSEYVTYEWSFAWGKGVKIFPILLKQTPLHPRLESLQYLDFTNRTSRPWNELIKSLKELNK